MAQSATIPIIDFAEARAGDARSKVRIAREVFQACTTAGFFYMANHGVPQAVIDGALAAGRAFFSEPVERKREVAVNRLHRGFNKLGDATMYGAKNPDYKEFFSVGLELPEDDPNVLAGEPLRGPNNWPAFLPTFRPAVYAYYEAIGACGRDLLRIVALSLGVDENFFESRYTKRLQRTQIVYYPPQPPELGDDQFGVAAHTDYGCITLLWQDDNGGLEVRERASGRWVDATPIPGTLVINVGDLLGRWTNDRFASTPHRVVNRSGRERFSIATFYDPDFSAVVDPREFGTPAAECKYEPVRTGDHILRRFEQSFGYRKKLAAGG